MDHALAFLFSVPPFLIYIVIFLVVFIEGEIILLIAGILARDQVLGFSFILAIGFIASVLHDLLYWEIGRRLRATRNDRILFIKRGRVDAILEKFKDKSGVYLFISKFTWGLTRLVFVAAGYTDRPKKEILRYSVPASFIWTITLVSLGYVFAAETHLLRKDIRIATILVTGFVLAVILIEYFVKRVIKNQG